METLKTNVDEKKSDLIKSDIFGLCTTMGTIVFLCLLTYFIIMRSIGLYALFALRDFNSVFLMGGIFIALSLYSKIIKGKIEYATGLKIWIRVTLTAVIPFALFIYFYLITDESFMALLKAKLNVGEYTGFLGEYMTPGIAAGIICLEGILSGIIITFIAMQYLKNK
jgi:hypothetical protein